MVRINYITSLDVNNYSGGWSGMNHNVYQQLKRRFDVELIQNINPPYFLKEKILSKVLRLVHLRGMFPAFSAGRLKKIKEQVESRLDTQAQFNFYHGSTPWATVTNTLPYAAYLDCCFASYISVYHDPKQFNSKQIDGLFKKEAEFLSNARSVFFSSRWALDDACAQYNLNGDNFVVAGLGGALEIDLPKQEISNPYFLFVGLDFMGKGGDKAVDAFNIVRKRYPHFTLKIVGEVPPEKFRSVPGVKYEGFFDKSDTDQFNKLISLFNNAFCFILPTSKDMTPLVLVEASSVGCPVIATNNFGIPEIVRNNETGILLAPTHPLTDQLVVAMSELVENKSLREKFVKKSSDYMMNNFTWERTGEIICDKILESLPGWRA